MGIRVFTSKGDVGRGIVLVDENGRPVRDGYDKSAVVTVPMSNVSSAASMGDDATRGSATVGGSNPSRQRSDAATSRTATRSNINTGTSDYANPDLDVVIKYGSIALGGLIALKVVERLLSTAVNTLVLLLLPLLYLHLLSTCPTNESFDAKQQLKRVMRGEHLPEEHKPQGIFERGLNRLAASVTAELATSLGYEVSVTEYFGVAKLTCVTVPVASYEYYWVGVAGKWRYLGQREVPGTGNG